MSQFCTHEETQARLDVCKTCDSFIIEDTGTSCAECVGGCSIGLLISHIEQTCPKDKW